MKKANFYNLLTVFVAVILLAGCNGLKVMKEQANDISYEVRPNPLEMHPNDAGEEIVNINIDGIFPKEYFDKNAIVVLTPVLKYSDGEKELKSVTLQGEKVKDNNAVIKYESGGDFEYRTSLEFEDAMRITELELRAKATVKSKSADLDPIKLADGIVTTPRLAKYSFAVDNPSYDGADALGKLSSIDVKLPATSISSYNADIHYALQRYNLRRDELKAEDIVKLFEDLNKAQEEDLVFKGAEISSYASPDGPLDLNTNLSEKRGKTAEKYLAKQIKKKTEMEISDEDIKSSTTPEDWDGFKEELNKAEVPDKELIKRVLSMYSDPVVREKEIKNISEAYEELKTEVLPQLRRSKLLFKFETKKKTDSEITTLAQSEPELLSEVELLYAAQITDDLNKKKTIYESFTRVYPEDWRAPNNLGVIYVYQNNMTEARKMFEKANALEENCASLNNLGVLELANNNMQKAEKLFNDAELKKATAETNYNLGYIYLTRGNYSGAVQKFGSSCTYSAALAKLLAKNVDGALTTLNCAEQKDNAMYFYLKAIIGSRKGDTNLLFTNLKTAVEKNSSLKEYAKKDIEFGKYFENSQFKQIVQ